MQWPALACSRVSSAEEQKKTSSPQTKQWRALTESVTWSSSQRFGHGVSTCTVQFLMVRSVRIFTSAQHLIHPPPVAYPRNPGPPSLRRLRPPYNKNPHPRPTIAASASHSRAPTAHPASPFPSRSHLLLLLAQRMPASMATSSTTRCVACSNRRGLVRDLRGAVRDPDCAMRDPDCAMRDPDSLVRDPNSLMRHPRRSRARSRQSRARSRRSRATPPTVSCAIPTVSCAIPTVPFHTPDGGGRTRTRSGRTRGATARSDGEERWRGAMARNDGPGGGPSP